MLRKLLLVIALAAISAAAWVTLRPASPRAASLTVFCAAGMKKPLEEIAAAYQKETGVEVRLQFGGTGTLLSQLKIAQQGDLFIAADNGALADAKKLGVTRAEFPLVKQKPVLAVAKGNPKHIDSLAALKNPAVKLALANPEAASIGRVVKKLLGPEWDALAAKAAVMKPTVTEIAGDLSLGAVDAAIIWDSIAPQFKLEIVVLPELDSHEEFATAAVLSFCPQPKAALQFVHYLTAPGTGAPVFQKLGFNAVTTNK